MLKDVKIVIGANFGDEGKGVMTDYFATKNENSIVVRFNGGPQAGHTVVTPDNKGHVFSHFGSSTLDDVPTYLSEFFIVNPILYEVERERLTEKLNKPTLAPMFVDMSCLVTTPYDMIINQIVEMSRGDNRHGSCGCGINETIRRSEDFDERFKLVVSDLRNMTSLRHKLELIQNEYVPLRLAAHGVTAIPDVFGSALTDINLLEAFMFDCAQFLIKVRLSNSDVLNNYSTIVLEGAQGLLLDQHSEYFPFVTHSNTGLTNVVSILNKLTDIRSIEVIYVTRCYMTRHGAGPFPYEIGGLPYTNVVDSTNIPNDWQGSLRFGLLDVTALIGRIRKDMINSCIPILNLSLAVTCLDQVDPNNREEIMFILSGEEKRANANDFLSILADEISNISNIYSSWGRTRETIKLYPMKDLILI